jgi:hypothetical protein
MRTEIEARDEPQKTGQMPLLELKATENTGSRRRSAGRLADYENYQHSLLFINCPTKFVLSAHREVFQPGRRRQHSRGYHGAITLLSSAFLEVRAMTARTADSFRLASMALDLLIQQ